MTYIQSTYKKCNFVKLAKSPLKPLKKADKSTKNIWPKAKSLLNGQMDGLKDNMN